MMDQHRIAGFTGRYREENMGRAGKRTPIRERLIRIEEMGVDAAPGQRVARVPAPAGAADRPAVAGQRVGQPARRVAQTETEQTRHRRFPERRCGLCWHRARL